MASTLANGKSDPGILLEDAANAEQAATAFIGALGKHRHPERETGALMP
jgi:catalase